eukprot:6725691-Prymnesium_polylepis.1
MAIQKRHFAMQPRGERRPARARLRHPTSFSRRTVHLLRRAPREAGLILMPGRSRVRAGPGAESAPQM